MHDYGMSPNLIFNHILHTFLILLIKLYNVFMTSIRLAVSVTVLVSSCIKLFRFPCSWYELLSFDDNIMTTTKTLLKIKFLAILVQLEWLSKTLWSVIKKIEMRFNQNTILKTCWNLYTWIIYYTRYNIMNSVGNI